MQIDPISLAERFHDEMFVALARSPCIDGRMLTRLSMDALHCDCIAVRLHLWCSSPCPSFSFVGSF